jgi:NAD(P)-dependent dehydrogenase (short-subunit alcohol dehydrogenase family)
MDLELTGKTVLITGGTDGLGLALATRLVAEGAAVGVCGRGEERLRAAERVIKAAGGDVLAQRADVSRPEDLEAFS